SPSLRDGSLWCSRPVAGTFGFEETARGGWPGLRDAEAPANTPPEVTEHGCRAGDLRGHCLRRAGRRCHVPRPAGRFPARGRGAWMLFPLAGAGFATLFTLVAVVTALIRGINAVGWGGPIFTLAPGDSWPAERRKRSSGSPRS